MARKLEVPVAAWALVGFLVTLGATGFYVLERGPPLVPGAQLALGVLLGLLALLIFAFSARKWLLVLLYRYGIFRPGGRAQDAVELARADLADLQTQQVDAGKLRAHGDIRKKAQAILERYNVERALRAVVHDRGAEPPKVEFERKQPFGKLEHYLYMHAALGAAAIAVALYHADFRLGGAVSGALLIAWLGACVTGVYGGYLYWVMPARLAAAEVKLGFDETRLQMQRLDHEIAEIGETKPDLKRILERQRSKLEEYYQPQARRKLQLESWLWVHIPLATASLVLLCFHVISVWYY